MLVNKTMATLLLSSLRGRLLLSVTLVLVIFLLVTGGILQKAYQVSLKTSIEARLQAHIYGLLTAADVKATGLVMPDILAEPLFNQISSELYAFVIDETGHVVWRSVSSTTIEIPVLSHVDIGQRYFSALESWHYNDYFYLSFGVLWELENGNNSPLQFVVLENQHHYQEQLNTFKQQLYFWLGIMSIVLIIVTLIVMMWSIKPIAQMQRDIQAIETGAKDKLTDTYLAELDGVADNINRLIVSERQQRKRYKDRIGDLAHSLKTPVAVLQGLTRNTHDEATIQDTLLEQTQRINQIVNYQLQRTVTGTQSLANIALPVKPLVSRVVTALDKVYSDKTVLVDIEIDESIQFFGEESDILEIIGNLCDNAYRLCLSRVSISAWPQANESRRIGLRVEDDGSGVACDKRELILQRGVRADSLNPGQGIGLAIVANIVDSYGGVIKIETSSLGGACFTVVV